jgi:cholesterol transport system auxiliary component
VRRRGIILLPLALAACGLSERPYAERREWPLLVSRRQSLPPRSGGKVLEVRTLTAGPGLDARGLQSLEADGSIRTAFYEEWAVPPAQGVEDALRRWLADSGRFAAVVAPGSRMPSDLALEGELTALWSEPAAGRAHAAIGVVVVDQPGTVPRIVLQRNFSADVPLTGDAAPDEVAAQMAALAEVFRGIETALG